MNIALIGNRGHWRYVFESIGEIPSAVVCALSPGCGDPMDPVLTACRESGFSPVYYEDEVEMLDKAHPDLAVVDGPFEKHAAMSIECLKRDIHVFCEKPIALNLTDLSAVETAYRNSRAQIYSMIGLRYEAPFQTALELVKSGRIGKVKLITTRKSYRLGKRPDFYKKRSTYGGTIPWVGSHALDWIMAFSGFLEFASISAVDTCADNFNHGELEIAAQGQFVMKNGVFAQASIDFLRPAAAPTHGDDQVRVVGTDGIIEVCHGKLSLLTATEAKEIPAESKRHLFSDIALACLGKRPALTTPEETIALTRNCLLTQQCADACKENLATGSTPA